MENKSDMRETLKWTVLLLLICYLVVVISANIITYYNRDRCNVMNGKVATLNIPCLFFDKFEAKDEICTRFYDNHSPSKVPDCTEWRLKDKCEKEPKTEGCVCDIYNYDLQTKIVHELALEKLNNIGKKDKDYSFFKDIYLYTKIKLEESKECVSAHQISAESEQLHSFNCNELYQKVLSNNGYDINSRQFLSKSILSIYSNNFLSGKEISKIYISRCIDKNITSFSLTI